MSRSASYYRERAAYYRQMANDSDDARWRDGYGKLALRYEERARAQERGETVSQTLPPN